MLATITAAFFRLFVWHQALGKPAHELAQGTDCTVEVLEELKWRFPKKYDRYSDRAMELVRNERAARCSANVEERFATAEAKDLPHLAKALEILARMQLLKAPTVKQATRRPTPPPEENIEWVETEVEEVTPEASDADTPDNPANPDCQAEEEDAPELVTREDYEKAVFHIELQKRLAKHPEMYQAVIDHVLKVEARNANKANPEPTPPFQ